VGPLAPLVLSMAHPLAARAAVSYQDAIRCYGVAFWMSVREEETSVGTSVSSWFDLAQQLGREAGLPNDKIGADLANAEGRRGVSVHAISPDYDAAAVQRLMSAVPECTELGRSYETSEGTKK